MLDESVYDLEATLTYGREEGRFIEIPLPIGFMIEVEEGKFELRQSHDIPLNRESPSYEELLPYLGDIVFTIMQQEYPELALKYDRKITNDHYPIWLHNIRWVDIKVYHHNEKPIIHMKNEFELDQLYLNENFVDDVTKLREDVESSILTYFDNLDEE